MDPEYRALHEKVDWFGPKVVFFETLEETLKLAKEDPDQSDAHLKKNLEPIYNTLLSWTDKINDCADEMLLMYTKDEVESYYQRIKELGLLPSQINKKLEKEEFLNQSCQ